jgi:hypothetical protein
MIAYSYLHLAGVHGAAERNTALAWYAVAALPFTTLFFIGLARSLVPIHGKPAPR